MQCSITCRIWIQDWCFERFYRLSWKIYTPSTRWSYLGDNVPTVRHVQWWHYGCGIVWSDTREEKQVQRQKKPQQQPTHRKSTGLLEASAFSELPTNTQIHTSNHIRNQFLPPIAISLTNALLQRNGDIDIIYHIGIRLLLPGLSDMRYLSTSNRDTIQLLFLMILTDTILSTHQLKMRSIYSQKVQKCIFRTGEITRLFCFFAQPHRR